MTQYNALKIKLSTSQLNKLKSVNAAKEGVKEDITLAKKVAPALKDVTP